MRSAVLCTLGCILFAGVIFAQDKAAPTDSAQTYVEQGRELFMANKFDEALQSFERAITLNPTFEEAWRGKGAVLWRMDRQDESIAATSRAIELKPDDYKAWLNKGRALMRKGQHADALATFEKASELKPDNEDALMGRFAMLRELKRADDMLIVLNRMIELKPSDPEVLAAEGHGSGGSWQAGYRARRIRSPRRNATRQRVRLDWQRAVLRGHGQAH